jgi:luciferase family oxidoreductase group 1
MRLSILDQSPISAGQTPHDALKESLKLAQAGEAFGYTRYWIAEHHDLPGLACSAPEIMLSYIGSNTSRIRLGSGAILLPHYKPFKVAEIFHMLSALFPGRIDLGIGRAPGGSAEASNALSDNFLQQVYKMPQKVNELVHFLNQDFPDDHEFSRVKAAPFPQQKPEPWLLGTSKKSALLAGENGLDYAFGQFMSDSDGEAIIQQYLDCYKPRKKGQKPQVILTVSVICADTDEKAEEIALSNLIWSLQRGKSEDGYVPTLSEAKAYKPNEKELEEMEKMKGKMIIGGPDRVKMCLNELQAKYKADEIMMVTITHNPLDRIHSYELIAKEILFSN